MKPWERNWNQSQPAENAAPAAPQQGGGKPWERNWGGADSRTAPAASPRTAPTPKKAQPVQPSAVEEQPAKPMPEMRAYEPTLMDRIKDFFPGDKDRASNERVARRIAERDKVSVESVYKGAGGNRPIMNPEGRAPVRSFTEGAGVVAEQAPDILPAAANTILRTIRGGDTDVDDSGWLDRAIAATETDAPQDIDPNYESLYGVGHSLGYSVTTMVSGALAYAGTTTLTGNPALGGAAAMGASGGVAYRGSKDEFLSRVREKLDEDAQKLYGRKINQDEWDRAYQEYEGAAQKYGAWEAIPEAVSNLIFIRAFTTPLRGASMGKLNAVKDKAAQIVGRGTGVLAAENVTETMTGVGQNRAELEAGLTDEKLSIGDAFRQQVLPTTVVTGLMGGGGAGAKLVAGRKRKKEEEEEDAGDQDAFAAEEVIGAPERQSAEQQDGPWNRDWSTPPAAAPLDSFAAQIAQQDAERQAEIDALMPPEQPRRFGINPQRAAETPQAQAKGARTPDYGVEIEPYNAREASRDLRIQDNERQLAGVKRPENLPDPRLGRLPYRIKLKRLTKLPIQESPADSITPEMDELLTAVAKAGGISLEYARAQGIDPAHFQDRPGRANPFRRDGKSFDEMAETLTQYGYPADTANALLDRVSESLSGNAVHSNRFDPQKGANRDALSLIEGMTPVETQTAIKKAMAGERLGVRQIRAVQAALDGIAGERAEGVDYARDQLEQARTERRQRGGVFVDMAGEMLSEPEYDAHWSAEARMIQELYEEAAEVDADAAEAIMERMAIQDASNHDIMEALDALITGGVREQAERRSVGGVGEVPGEPGQGARTAAPGRDGRGVRGPQGKETGEGRQGDPAGEVADRRHNAKARALYESMTREQLLDELLNHELTGIKGRRAFVVEVEDAVQVVSIDADSLKWVNDAMGADAGDRLLQGVADALTEQFGDRAYHISGDEFYVLAFTDAEAAAIGTGMERVQKQLDGDTLKVTKPDGEVITKQGLHVTYATGPNKKDADHALKREKSEREQRGERAGRGDEPPGITRTGLVRSTAERETGRDPGVGTDPDPGRTRADDRPRVTQPAPQETPAPAGVSASGPMNDVPDTDVGDMPQGLDEAANQAATSPENDRPEPTDAQKHAGNYKKGHLTLHGLDITIENPRGSKRSGVSPDGKRWESTMAHHYGYFKRTEGKDGDHVDVFLTDGAEDPARPVFIVDQVEPKTRKFDEHKVVMGAATEQEAREAYLANYEKGWDGIGGVAEMSLEQFKDWLKNGDTTKRVAEPDKQRRLKERLTAKRGERAAKRAQNIPGNIPDDQEQSTDGGSPEAAQSLYARHNAINERMRDGNLSLDEYRQSFEDLVSNREAVIAELSKETKNTLLERMSGMMASRYKPEKKDRVVRALYVEMLEDYLPPTSDGGMYSYSPKIGGDYVQNMIDAVREKIESVTQEKLDAYAERIAKTRVEREQAIKARAEGLKDPQTLEDFRAYMRAQLAENEGMTVQEARMTLTLEQRKRFDDLAAEKTRSERADRKMESRTEVRAAGVTTGAEIVETQHTRDGYDLFVVQAAERVERDVYQQWLAAAKKLGGWYSSFRGRGAVPGFQFKTREAAEAFQQYVSEGNTEAVQEQAKARRDAFEDDRSQSAADRLKEMADTLEERADASLNQDRKTNTARRASMAARAESAANYDKALATTMRNIAEAIDADKAKFLDRVRTKAQVEMLDSIVVTAKAEQLRERYPSYGDYEKHRGEPPDAETADFATWPTYTAYRSDLARLGREALETEGMKQIGQRILKVADDVTDAYLDFASENLHKVSTFSTSDGSKAVFASKPAAEAAIARSGYRGRAIVLPVKRGENLIIMSPSEAQNRGIWDGDQDKRITLSPDLAELLIGKARKAHGMTVPWIFESVHDKRKRLESMGIETPAEFRAALREYIDLRQRPAERDTIKEMERAMVGRRNDGLDFFPTPTPTAQEMIETADIRPGMRVLEPSAGMGHIAQQLRDAGFDPDVVEFSSERRELLKAKGFEVVGNDFMALEVDPSAPEVTASELDAVEEHARSAALGNFRSARLFYDRGDYRGAAMLVRRAIKNTDYSEFVSRAEPLADRLEQAATGAYDRIIMNPPFSKRRDAEHVQHAYSLLKPGGRLIAIMGEGVFFGQDKKAQEFREWLEKVGGTEEKLAEGTFQDPTLPVNTGVNARMVVIDKPKAGVALFARSPRLKSGPTEDQIYRAENPTQGQSADTIREAIAPVILTWGDNAPTVEVVQAERDLPRHLRQQIEATGAEGTVQGIHDPSTGNVYLVADGLENKREALKLLAHEAVGHYGMEEVLGEQYQKALDRVKWLKRAGHSKIRELAERVQKTHPGVDANTEAREIIAALAEERQFGGVLKDLMARLYAAVRAFLRRMGFKVLWTTPELNALLARSARYLREDSGRRREVSGLEHRQLGEIDVAIGKGRTGASRFVAEHPDIAANLEDLVAGAKLIEETPTRATLENDGVRFDVVKKNGRWALTDARADFARAYHGTPHKFDRFSLDAIGTGEGAQAYGWGLYFAGKREVAEYYKKTLSPDKGIGARILNDGDGKFSVWGVKPGHDMLQRVAADLNEQEAKAVAEKWEKENAGNLYQVDIPDDSQLLDWDATWDDQPAFVQKALEQSDYWKYAEDRLNEKAAMRGENFTGMDIYRDLLEDYEPQEASEFLNSLGIPGLRYLDGTSRDGKGGSHNYVIWDENAVTVEAVNDEVRQANFARRAPATQAEEKQHSFLSGLAGGQPIDRMFRLPFDVFGMVDAHGRMKGGVKLEAGAERILKDARFSESGRFAWINPMLETARAGLIDRYGLSEEYKQREAERQADERRVAMQAMDIIEKLRERGVNAAESRTLQAVLTGEKIAEGDWKALAEPIRKAIDDLGQEAVSLGLISEESYQRNRGTYLHRVYLKHETNMGAVVGWVNKALTKRRRHIVGDSLKGRGMDMKVEVSDLFKHVPQEQRDTLDPELKGAKFKVLDLLDKSEEGRPKVLKRAWWPAGLPVPEKLKAYEDRGTWEVRGVKAGKLILWRDFTKAERESMGEILDARYTIAKTFQLMAHDLAAGRFFADIAQNPDWATDSEPDGVVVNALQAGRLATFAGVDWVKVPDIAIPKSGAKKWGALSGQWVRAEIWRDLNELDRMQHAGTWQKVMTQWKLNKTARSPVVHMNNVMSNLILMDLIDVRTTDLVRGIQEYLQKGELYKEATENGAFGGTFVAQEIRRDILEPLLEEIAKENRTGGGLEQKINILSKLGYWLKKADKKMVDFYQVEDEVFRMATYMRRRSLGDSAAEAATLAREQFLNYDIRAPWVNAARQTVLPFISYTYRAVPAVAQAIAHRPWKLAKYATLAYLANAMAYMMAPGDEDEERRSMREEVQGRTWIGVPRMLRMPWRDEQGNPVFLDIRRWIPAGDVFDMNQGQSAVPIPAPLQFGGPLMLGAELMLNKQAFTGKEIINDRTDDWWDRTTKISDWGWKSWMPSAAWIPGGHYWDRIGTAVDGGRDAFGRPYSVPQAVSSSVGIKVQPHDVQTGFALKGMDFNRTKQALTFELRQLARDKDRGLISKERFERELARVMKKLDHLRGEAQETFTGR